MWKQYRKKCLVDEIKITNEIEGVNSTRKEINDILNSKVENNKNTRLYGLVKKYDLLEEEEIKLNCCEDIRELYNELVLKEVIEEDSKNKPDGKIFRKEEVYVQNPTGKIIHSGVYPEENIIFNMTKGLNILNNDEYDYMIRIAVFHYIFGYIHPFYDGNGRTSRFISSYLLSKNLHPLVSYKLASTIKENLNSYYKSFKETNDEKNKGDLTIFVMKFFDILIKSLMELCDSLDEGYNKLNYFTNISEKMCVGDSRKFKVLFILIQNTLFGDEGLDIDDLSSICKIGKSKIRSSLKELEENNILYIKKNGKKDQLTRVLYKINSTIEIDPEVTIIGPYAFDAQTELTQIVIPEGVITIMSGAFYYCPNLIKVEIPKTVTNISNNSFANATSKLEEIIIHNKEKSISGAPWGAVKGMKVVNWVGK